jgi:hypothetical protein
MRQRNRLADHTDLQGNSTKNVMMSKTYRSNGETRKESLVLGEKYSITPIIRINCDRQPSGYAENPDNWIFL